MLDMPLYYFLAHRVRPDIAGWSSLVARRAHNPEVVGSNPAPATINLMQTSNFHLLVCFFRIAIVPTSLMQRFGAASLAIGWVNVSLPQLVRMSS